MTATSLAAVLWDMDGTLIDSEPLWLAAEEAMLSRYGLAMSEELHHSLIGSGLAAAAERFRELGVPLTVEEILAEWAREVGAGVSRGEVRWRPGARELLASLRAAGIPCALVTMSMRSLADLTVALLPSGTFAAIIAGDEVAHEKPHPDPYLRGAAALGVPPERCLAIEDSPTGLRSARAAGTVAIGVPNLLDLAGADLAEDERPHEVWATLSGVDAAAVRLGFARQRRASVDLRP